MTPAIAAAKKAKIWFAVHEYEHDPAAESFGKESAEKLETDPARVFKTLVVAVSERDLAVMVVPVLHQLDLKLAAKALGVKKAAMADVKQVERATGYVLGGVSPLGQKKRLPTVVDASAAEHASVFVSGGRRGLDIELAPSDLCALTGGVFAPVAR
jgi:Cys-tRNA(Pro)/Cys-tRNA(Cys) deacylase